MLQIGAVGCDECDDVPAGLPAPCPSDLSLVSRPVLTKLASVTETRLGRISLCVAARGWKASLQGRFC
jgi:hypothetical protein